VAQARLDDRGVEAGGRARDPLSVLRELDDAQPELRGSTE